MRNCKNLTDVLPEFDLCDEENKSGVATGEEPDKVVGLRVKEKRVVAAARRAFRVRFPVGAPPALHAIVTEVPSLPTNEATLHA